MPTRLPDEGSRLVITRRLGREGRVEVAANTHGGILYDIAAQLFGDGEAFVSDESFSILRTPWACGWPYPTAIAATGGWQPPPETEERLFARSLLDAVDHPNR